MRDDVSAPAASGKTAPAQVTLEDLRDDQLFKLIERARIDPVIAELVAYLQKQAFDKLGVAAQHLLDELNRIDGPASGKPASGPISVLALASEARQRERVGKDKREFAELLAIGALANRNNPHWDMFDQHDPSAQAPSTSGMLALLNWKPSA